MLHVVLYQPEIPPNTGNIMRLCAATGSTLHLVGRLGFRMDEASLRRAGMDYREWATVLQHEDWAQFLPHAPPPNRLFAFSTHGTRYYHEQAYQPGDGLLFGAEGSGLPLHLREAAARQAAVLRIPMVPRARSLNLANSVAIVLYEAMRQIGFPAAP
jgi:tRNA (cytidine/uridine-2'-O-)-methyltransferase